MCMCAWEIRSFEVTWARAHVPQPLCKHEGKLKKRKAVFNYGIRDFRQSGDERRPAGKKNPN